jgi:hypothetical protein
MSLLQYIYTLKNGLSDFGNRFGGTFLSVTSTSSHIRHPWILLLMTVIIQGWNFLSRLCTFKFSTYLHQSHSVLPYIKYPCCSLLWRWRLAKSTSSKWWCCCRCWSGIETKWGSNRSTGSLPKIESTSLRCSSSCLLGSLSLWNTISFFIKI